MRTYTPKPRDIQRRWYVIDASGAVLGRLATEVASILRGKHKPIYAPHVDTGDHVIVVNARGVRLTGGKEEKKVAYRHSGYPGGLSETKYSRLLAEKPHFAVERAVKGMLPKNRLGRAMAKKLQVYPGPEHPHQAQKPQPLRLGEVPPWEGLPNREVITPRAGRTEEPTLAGAGARPVAKRSTAKRSSAKRTATSTPERAATSTSKTATGTSTRSKSVAKSGPTSSAAKGAAKGASKSTAATGAAKSTAKRSTTRRTEKEE